MYVQWISVNKNVSFKLSTPQKVKEFFSKCDQISSFLRIWSHLSKKSLMENFIFCAVQMEIGKLNFPQNMEINFNDLQLNLSNVTVCFMKMQNFLISKIFVPQKFLTISRPSKFVRKTKLSIFAILHHFLNVLGKNWLQHLQSYSDISLCDDSFYLSKTKLRTKYYFKT